ncbi:ATP-grasp domain-containing protein [Myxococcota bacterium]|nr:ATP-grasp domain-containing protein [Myxococcota bacterium]
MSVGTRVFIVERGPMAVWIDRCLRAQGAETVVAFSEDEEPSPRLDEATYAAFVPDEPTMDQLIGAANDAGCDAIHPGLGRLAEDPAFAQEVAAANLLMIGPPYDRVGNAGDRHRAREVSRRAKVMPVPGTGLLRAGDAAPIDEVVRHLGLPLWIKDNRGRLAQRAETAEQADALAKARLGAGEAIWFEAHVRQARHLVVAVAADAKGSVVALGVRERSLRKNGMLTVDQLPASISTQLAAAVEDAAVAVAKGVGLQGLGAVGFLTDPSGAAWCLGLRPRLDLGMLLNDHVYGLRSPELQLRVARGEALGFKRSDLSADGVALGFRIRALAPGEIETWEPPADALVFGEPAPTQRVSGLLAVLVVRAPTRQACIVKAQRLLKSFVVTGVETNIPAHLESLGDPGFWSAL